MGSGPIVYETHLHTPLCRHAVGEPEEYAAVAQQRGLKGITITCHNPLPDGYSQDARMYPDQFPEYFELVRRAQRNCAGRIDVRLGMECDFVVGMEEHVRRQVESAPFDYLLGSIHPHVTEYRQTYWRGSAAQFQRTYYEHLALAAESRMFDCISHPDVVKNVFPEEWRLKRIWADVCRALDRIAAVGVAMELNTSGVLKEIPEMNPGSRILKEMCKRGIPVVVGADAHDPQRVASGYREAYTMLEKAGYRSVSFFVQRRRYEVPIAQARSSLAPAEASAA